MVWLGESGGRGWRLARVTHSGRQRESGCWGRERVTHPGWHAEARKGGVAAAAAAAAGFIPQLKGSSCGLTWVVWDGSSGGVRVSTLMGGSGFKSGILTGLPEADKSYKK